MPTPSPLKQEVVYKATNKEKEVKLSPKTIKIFDLRNHINVYQENPKETVENLY